MLDNIRLNRPLSSSIDSVMTVFDFLQIFQANNDSDSVVTNTLSPSILARFIRVLPLEWNQLETICLRLELYGCETSQGNRKKAKINPLRIGSSTF